jgi:hypothetical protein
MPQDHLIFNIPVEFRFLLCLSFEVSNVDVRNSAEQAPAEKLIVLTSVLFLDALTRVQVHQYGQDPLRQSGMRTLLEARLTVLLSTELTTLERLCGRAKRLVQFAGTLMHIRSLCFLYDGHGTRKNLTL